MSKEFNTIVSINDLNNGAVDELVKDILPEILNNLGDENTKWAVERGFDVKVRIRLTDESRETAITTVEVVKKLANPKPHESMAHLAFDGIGVEMFTVKESPEQEELENVREFKREAK